MLEISVFVVTFIAAFFSSMSGGGTAIINVPFFLYLGYSLPLTMSFILANSVFWVLPASYNYLKNQVVEWRFILIFAFLGLLGSILGIYTIVSIDKGVFTRIVGLIIVTLVVYVYLRKNFGILTLEVDEKKKKMSYFFAPALGFYESVFGAGNGIAFTFLGHYTRGFDLMRSLGHYYAIAFFWTLLSLVLLVSQGYYDIRIMFFSVSGSLVGAIIGSRYARKKGNDYIKKLFVVIGFILGLKLLLGF